MATPLEKTYPTENGEVNNMSEAAVTGLEIAVIGMAGALLALVIDRRREMAVLRFLGASTGQIRYLRPTALFSSRG